MQSITPAPGQAARRGAGGLPPFPPGPAMGGLSGARQILRRLLERRASMAWLVAHQVIVFVALLLIAIQAATLVAINWAVSDNARRATRAEIDVGHRIFLRLLADRAQQLTTAATVLTADFGLRQALMSGDRATMLSALENHGARIGAGRMMLVGLDQRLLGDTLAPADGAGGANFAFPRLLAEARRQGTAAAVAALDGVPYQLVAVPVLAPVPVAWVVIGFSIDAKFAQDLGVLTGLDVSFASWERGAGWRIAASTMPAAASAALRDALGRGGDGLAAVPHPELELGGYEVSVSPLARGANRAVVAVLQRSLGDSIGQFDGLRRILLVLAVFSLGGTVVGSLLIARLVSRPVSALAAFARRMERGEYEEELPATRSSELGELAATFNRMRLAIAAREEQIKALALQDALTGLPNRALFNERLQQAIGVGRRLHHPVSVLLLDLNRFKEVNDTLGHHVGDFLLCEVAARLRGVLARSSDTAARLGGDEFAVLLPATDAALAEATARKILRAFEAPVTFEDRLLDVGGSIGVATFPDHGDEPGLLMSRADAAMYAAKRHGLGCAVHETGLAAAAGGADRLSLTGELRRAVELDELVLHYQPRLSLGGGGRVWEVEALVRWRHPSRGFVPPDQFIPFAEQTGCIRDITHWVLDRAFAQGARWRARGLDLVVSINLSVRDLLAADLPERIGRLLARRDASPEWFLLEITESAIMDDPARALATVERLHAMGFRLSIDDFGTGYSSLAQLKRLPVAELKIDKSFVINMASDGDDMTIVRSVIDLAHNMALRVVAEGVETREVLDLLGPLGCDAAQGYHICKPVPGEELEAWLAARSAAAPPGAAAAAVEGERT